MPTLNINSGLSIKYIDSNPSGYPCVLLLHGLGATGESWTFQIPALTNTGFRVIAPDMRGFGQSSYTGDLSIASMAKDMASLLIHLEAVPCIVVGISMGGIIAQELILTYPNLVRKLVLVNTFSSLRPQKFSFWIYYAIRFLLVHILGITTQANFVAQRVFPYPSQAELRRHLINQIKQADPAAYRAALRSLAFFNSKSRLAQITAPTLLITGDRDDTVPPESQRELAAQIERCDHVYIKDCGHAASVEQPHIFNQTLINFLNREDPITSKFHQ